MKKSGVDKKETKFKVKIDEVQNDDEIIINEEEYTSNSE